MRYGAMDITITITGIVAKDLNVVCDATVRMHNEQTIQQHHCGRYALACGLGVSVAIVGDMICVNNVKH